MIRIAAVVLIAAVVGARTPSPATPGEGGGEGLGFQISDLRSQISDLRFQISDSRFEISDLRFQISDLRFEISNLRFQISNLRFQISNQADPHPDPLAGGRQFRSLLAGGRQFRSLLPEYRERESNVRFSAVDVFIDSGAAPLAAYQFELKVTAGDVTLVGVEGGEHAAFSQPPFYDPKALAMQRIVIAAFDTGSDLPRGRTRVARLMVRVSGDVTPAYDATLAVAASADAKTVPATISVSDTSGSEGAER